MAEVSEGCAALNTLMRFHRYRQALPAAYALRVELQLAVPMTAGHIQELESVQEVIAQLEAYKVPFWKQFLRSCWDALVPGDKVPHDLQ